MKKKAKLFVAILALCVSVFCLTFGVYAAAKVLNYSVEGSVVYDGDAINAKFTLKGCSNLSYSGSLSDFNFNEIYNPNINMIYICNDWQNLDITLISGYQTSYIKYTITNQSKVCDLKINYFSATQGNNNGANWSITVDGYADINNVIIKRGESADVTITFSRTNTSGDLYIYDFNTVNWKGESCYQE